MSLHINPAEMAVALAPGENWPQDPDKIICFVGERGSGKDTAADALALYGFEKMAYADGVREVAKVVFGITDHEMSDRVLKEAPLGRGKWGDQQVRWFLKLIGTECFRDNFPGVWIERLWRLARGVSAVVIPDTRFWDEYEAGRARGAIFVRIDNPRVKPSTDTHRSEIEWREFPVDHVLVNDHDSADAFKMAVLEWYSNLPTLN